MHEVRANFNSLFLFYILEVKNMLKNKRIIALILLAITLFSSFSNCVYAIEINKANLTTIEDSDSQIQFKYDSGWTNVRTNYIGYRENGKIYPAYCISHRTTWC